MKPHLWHSTHRAEDARKIQDEGFRDHSSVRTIRGSPSGSEAPVLIPGISCDAVRRGGDAGSRCGVPGAGPDSSRQTTWRHSTGMDTMNGTASRSRPASPCRRPAGSIVSRHPRRGPVPLLTACQACRPGPHRMVDHEAAASGYAGVRMPPVGNARIGRSVRDGIHGPRDATTREPRGCGSLRGGVG
jgi:hypothetical protein